MKIKKELFHYFEQAGTKVTYHPQDIIYMQEDNTNSLYLILKGKVRVYHLTPTGEEITFDILKQGRIFGESSFFQNSARPTTVVAINEVELISCHLKDLYPYLHQSPELTMSLLTMMSQTIDYLTTLVKRSYTYNRYEKIASFLLEQSHTSNEIHHSHEDIAMMVGLARVTVTKILNEFANKGYIALSYRCIKILNKDELMKILSPESHTKRGFHE